MKFVRLLILTSFFINVVDVQFLGFPKMFRIILLKNIKKKVLEMKGITINNVINILIKINIFIIIGNEWIFLLKLSLVIVWLPPPPLFCLFQLQYLFSFLPHYISFERAFRSESNVIESTKSDLNQQSYDRFFKPL